MTLESAEVMARELTRYRNFEECILEDVRWYHYGTVLELVFDYIWADDGGLRPEFARPCRKTIRFRNVQEFHVWNELTEQMSLHPNELNWGLSEVASVRLVDEEPVLARYQLLPIPLHHIRCNWEGGRRIEIVFSTMDID